MLEMHLDYQCKLMEKIIKQCYTMDRKRYIIVDTKDEKVKWEKN